MHARKCRNIHHLRRCGLLAIYCSVLFLPGLSMADLVSHPSPLAAEKVYAKAYPTAFEGVETKHGLLIFNFLGRAFLYDDQITKSDKEVMAAPDLQDTLAQPYPPGSISGPLTPEADPGRIRSQTLMETLYGMTEEEVRKNLVDVRFCGHKVPFNRQQGAAAALEAVGTDLGRIAKENPEITPYLEKLGGSYNRRKIAGTDRLSAHSFGIAIDLNPAFARYWRWDQNRTDFRPEEFPIQIVEIFERHGFIWGGKWSHYDSMHFEYRPELILLAKESSPAAN